MNTCHYWIKRSRTRGIQIYCASSPISKGTIQLLLLIRRQLAPLLHQPPLLPPAQKVFLTTPLYAPRPVANTSTDFSTGKRRARRDAIDQIADCEAGSTNAACATPTSTLPSSSASALQSAFFETYMPSQLANAYGAPRNTSGSF